MEKLPSKPAIPPQESPPDGSFVASDRFGETTRGPEASGLDGYFVLPRSRCTAYDMIFGDDPWVVHDACLSNLHPLYPPHMLLGPVPSRAFSGGIFYSPTPLRHGMPAVRASYISGLAEAELATTLESLLDDAIDSAAATGAAIDRLSQTFQAFHDWTSEQLGARRATVSE